MSDPLVLVRTRLLAISTVTALVALRIYSGVLPQHPTPPTILLRLIDRVTDSHLRGGAGLLVARVQLHHAAVTRADAVALANAVEGDGAGSALSHFSGVVAGKAIAGVFPGNVDREEFHSGKLLQHEVIRDYLVHYQR